MFCKMPHDKLNSFLKFKLGINSKWKWYVYNSVLCVKKDEPGILTE